MLIKDGVQITNKSIQQYKKLINECFDNDCDTCNYSVWCTRNLHYHEPLFEEPAKIMAMLETNEIEELKENNQYD